MINFQQQSYSPDLHLLGDDAPAGVVVVRGDDVQVLDVLVDQLVELALPEDVVVLVIGDLVRGQGLLRGGTAEGAVADAGAG